MKGINLYTITQQYADALDFIEDAETFEQIKETLDAIEANLNDKLDSIGRIRKNKIAQAKALKEEAKELTEKAKKIENEVANFEKWIDHTLRAANLKKVETGMFKYSYRTSTSLEIMDSSQIPEHFLKPQPSKVDVAGLKAHLKKSYEENGLKVPEEIPEIGVKFVTKQNLQIK